MKSIVISLVLWLIPATTIYAKPVDDRAVRLARMLHRQHSQTSAEEIAVVLREIDRNLPRYFPHGPFTQEDFVAIAMTESEFNRHCVGTSGERGVFQIMPYYKHKGDLSSPSVNTELAFRILLAKYKQHGTYRKAIIAYNGFIIRNGKLLDRYWIRFSRQKSRVHLALAVHRAPIDPEARKLQIELFG